jgi:hypothetical protein
VVSTGFAGATEWKTKLYSQAMELHMLLVVKFQNVSELTSAILKLLVHHHFISIEHAYLARHAHWTDSKAKLYRSKIESY